MSVSPNTTTNTIKELVLGYTDDSSIYRDTEISRYWYRACLDTFWYRDTKSIAILFDTFCRYCTWLNLLIRCFGNFVTLMVSVGLILRFMHVLVRLHFVLVQTISLINLKLSVSINVEISYAFYPCDNSYMMGPCCLMDWKDSSAVTIRRRQRWRPVFCATLRRFAITDSDCLFSRQLPFNWFYVDDVIVGCSRHGSTTLPIIELCFKLRTTKW